MGGKCCFLTVLAVWRKARRVVSIYIIKITGKTGYGFNPFIMSSILFSDFVCGFISSASFWIRIWASCIAAREARGILEKW